MKYFRTLLISLSIFVLAANLPAQFVDTNVEIKAERLKEQERNDLKNLKMLLPQYFENYQWIDNSYGIEIALNMQVFPQSVNNTGFERVFSGQLFLSNSSGDQRFFEKSFKFVYNTNDPVTHQDMPHPLTSALDFYAWMMIAAELDTYDPLGGNSSYEKAREVAQRALMSERPHGWKNRIQVLDEILRQRDYRLFKYNWWSIVDLIDQEEYKNIPKAIQTTLKNLNDVLDVNARERYTHVFLDAHAREFMEMLKNYGTEEQRITLLELDPDNEEVYNTLLDE